EKGKGIQVNAGNGISVQMEQSRSEHWVIVKGEAFVTIGDNEFTLRVNQDALIPTRTKHRVANNGSEPVVFIEVQCGAYLGEDDITRFEDDYERIAKG